MEVMKQYDNDQLKDYLANFDKYQEMWLKGFTGGMNIDDLKEKPDGEE